MPSPEGHEPMMREPGRTEGGSGPRVATAPVNWNNDDVPDLRPHIPYHQMLREMRDAGYGATEYGSGIPFRIAEVAQALSAEGLVMVGSFCAVPLDAADFADRALPRVLAVASFLQALGADVLLLSDAIRENRSAWAGRTDVAGAPRWTRAERSVALKNAHHVGRRLAEMGIHVAFHPHAGTYVEAPSEVRWLLDESDPDLIGLCLDTGHVTYGGGNPLEIAREYAERVRIVHLKDVHESRLSRARAERWSFQRALRAYLFPRLGEGVVDFPGILAALRAKGFAGWLVVEQDTQEGSALDAARANRAYLHRTFGL